MNNNLSIVKSEVENDTMKQTRGETHRTRGGFVMVKFFIRKEFALLLVGIILIGGCVPSITVTKKDLKVDERTDVEYKLGTDVAMDEWVTLKNNVCNDLAYATEGIPDDTRQNILKYACVESDSDKLGETLATLQPDQIERICSRLSEKGYITKNEKITFGMERLLFPPLFILVMMYLI
jgi:hypothetical protein